MVPQGTGSAVGIGNGDIDPREAVGGADDAYGDGVVKRQSPAAVRHLSPEAWLRRYGKGRQASFTRREVRILMQNRAHSLLVLQTHDYLTLHGWLVIRTHGSKQVPVEAGVCDMVALRGGHTLLLELKVGHDRLKPKQIQFRDRARAHGYEVIEVRSLEDVIAAIKGLPRWRRWIR